MGLVGLQNQSYTGLQHFRIVPNDKGNFDIFFAGLPQIVAENILKHQYAASIPQIRIERDADINMNISQQQFQPQQVQLEGLEEVVDTGSYCCGFFRW